MYLDLSQRQKRRKINWPRPVAQTDVCLRGMRMVAGLILGSGNILSLKLVMKSFLRPLVSGKRMCT